MKAALQNYHARMQRVLDYIDRHLGFFAEVPEHEAVAELFLPLK
jgi:hypothetical protein